MKHHAKAPSAGSTEANGKRARSLLATLALAICALALTASPASADPPKVLIGSVSDVSYTSAKVTGEVDTGEIVGEYFFEVSTDNVNWSPTGIEGELSGAPGPQAIERTITGLKGGTKYFVRLSAYNFAEFVPVSSPEPNPDFTTLPVDPPSVVSIEDASNVGYTVATVKGSVKRPEGNADPAFDVKCEFEYVVDAQFQDTGFEGASKTPCDQPNPITAEGESQVETKLTGLNPATTYHLRLTASNAGGSDSKVAASTFTTQGPVPAPSVTVNPVTVFTDHTATFTGTVNPGGTEPPFFTFWSFKCVPECGTGAANQFVRSFDPDEADHPVLLEVTGLEPNTAYEVRTIAKNSAEVQSESTPVSFKTLPTLAEVQSGYASGIETDTATLNARLNPHNSPATYQFEWGLDQSYGHLDPTSPAALGEVDNFSHPVSQAISGLQPATTYHFRLSATNTDTGKVSYGSDRTFRTPPADECPNEQLRAENKSLTLPDCRAYERVSPLSKSGNDVGNPVIFAVAAADGDAVMYPIASAIEGSYSGVDFSSIARRGVDRWTSTGAIPVGTQEDRTVLRRTISGLLFDRDLTRVAWLGWGSWLKENPPTQQDSGAIYRAPVDGEVEWLSKPQVGPVEGDFLGNFQVVGATPDLDTVYFWAKAALLPGEDPRVEQNGPWELFEYSGEQLKNAGILPDGALPAGGAAPANTSLWRRAPQLQSPAEMPKGQVSRDGSSLYFISPDPNYPGAATSGIGGYDTTTELYLRRGGHSVLVSHDENGDAAPTGVSPVSSQVPPASPLVFYPFERLTQYVFGSPDGSSAIFQSRDVLTSNAPDDGLIKAYRYDVASDTITYLPGLGGATILASSDDAQRFLFSYDSEAFVGLPAEGFPSLPGVIGLHLAGKDRIGVWDHGTVTTVSATGRNTLVARATPDGSAFVFLAAGLTGFNSGLSNVQQIYRYDLDTHSLNCLSCPPEGITPSDASVGPTTADAQHFHAGPDPAFIINKDASRVFFDTASPLVPGDENSVTDVYEWTPSGPALLSPGKSEIPSNFLVNSASGNDVFFATKESIDPADTDGTRDVYDARVGGGFPQAAAVSPCVGNEVCKKAPAPAPKLPGPATNSFTAQNEGFNNRKGANRIEVGGHRVAGGTLKLKLVLPRPGTVFASGKGLKRAKHTYAKAGSHQLKLVLRPAARKALRETRKLRLKIHLRFLPASGKPSSANVVLTVKG